MEAFKAKYGYDLAVPKTGRQLRDIAEFFHRPDQKRYGIAIYTDNSYDAMAMGVENAIFTLSAASSATTRPTRSTASSTPTEAVAALEAYRELYKFTPPGWGKTFFVEDNQAITEGLAAMSMNFFAFFPALVNEATNPNAKSTGFFANPAGPERRAVRRARRAGHLDRLLLEEAGRGDEVPRVVHQGRDPEEVGRARRLHLQRGGAEVGRVPQRHAVQQGLLPDHVHGEGLLGGAGICRTADQMNQRVYPYVVGGEGTAKEALDALAADWNATFKKYGRVK